MSPHIRLTVAALLIPILAMPATAQQTTSSYLPGGPLSGVELPKFPTQHGEPAGHPGAIGAPPQTSTISEVWGKEDLAPEWQLYPGSVEHWRAYWMKYVPTRSLYDVQSQLKNWVAPNIPGVEPDDLKQYSEPLYWIPRHAAPRFTGKNSKPVPVVEAKVADPIFELDFGTLPVGVYVVRVIAAVPTEQMTVVRKPLFWKMRVNDQPGGGTSEYRIRGGYVDDFYSIAEIYFHADEAREYSAQLWVDEGSEVTPLIHNITLDDALAGALRRPIKTRSISQFKDGKSPEQLADATREELKKRNRTVRAPLSDTERLARDAAIWKAFPPINAQGSGTLFREASHHIMYPEAIAFGVGGKSQKEIEDQHGVWEYSHLGVTERGGDFTFGLAEANSLLVNKKLGLSYSMEDLQAGRALPDPYPFKNTGVGIVTDIDGDDKEGKGQVWAPIADGVRQRIAAYPFLFNTGSTKWLEEGDQRWAHDASVALARWAYALPTIDPANYLTSIVQGVGPYGREYRARRRQTEAMYMRHYMDYLQAIEAYDKLWVYIKDNQELANSIHRFVPWVKTPEDVRRLLDVYLVQHTVKRIMRYHWYTHESAIAQIATWMGNNEVTDPWMEWLFSRTFIYPLPVAGIQDVMITGTDRDGTQYIGSTYYAQEGGAMEAAQTLREYLRHGGNPKFDLSDPKRYPKASAQAYWRFQNVIAGGDFLRMGSVGGPDKKSGHTLLHMEEPARRGWEWTKDPRFAFVLKHYVGQGEYSADEWSAIERAAASVTRAPWLSLPSRMMPHWAGILETGLQHEDWRFRRAAWVRVGYGYGHHHDDTLDLQIVAHGLPMTIDGGQRPGYSVPSDRITRVHNVVEVDGLEALPKEGDEQRMASWVRTLADVQGSRYLMAEAVPPRGSTLFRRQTALIDVDEGNGSQPLPPAQQLPTAELPKGITTGNSYVFDVFRVAGGRVHTYNFHATVDDEFTWNAEKVVPRAKAGEAAQSFLQPFKEQQENQFVGTAPSTLEATWRLARDGQSAFGTEPFLLGKNYDANSPRKYTRLTLFDVAGATAMRGPAVSTQWKYDYTNLMVQRRSDAPQQNAFAAIIEPYVGEPFILGKRLLPIAGNENDALRAVAVAVQTKNGHTDVNFADGRPEKVRKVGNLTISGEYAFYSVDAQGLRQASLTGGTLLQTPTVRMQTAQRERTGKVTKVNFLNKSFQIDEKWPARTDNSLFEIGTPAKKTAYHLVQSQPNAQGTLLLVQGGAEYYRSQVEEIDSQTGIVKAVLDPITQRARGNEKDWYATNEDGTRSWRAEYLGDQTFKLTGAPVSEEAFEEAGVLRLWEYGVGDTVRQSTFANLRRVAPNTYVLNADEAVTISLPGKAIELSTDGQTWRRAKTKTQRGWSTFKIAPEEAITAPLQIRVLS